MRINCRRNRAGRQCCARQTPPCPHGSFNQALNIDTIFLMLKILQICPIFLRIKISLIRMVYNALYNLVSVCISRFLVLKALNLLFFFFFATITEHHVTSLWNNFLTSFISLLLKQCLWQACLDFTPFLIADFMPLLNFCRTLCISIW